MATQSQSLQEFDAKFGTLITALQLACAEIVTRNDRRDFVRLLTAVDQVFTIAEKELSANN